MKKCVQCNRIKKPDQFHKKGNRLAPRCKACTKKYRADLYKNWSPEQHKALRDRVSKRLEDFKEKVSKIKESTPCTDCGNFYDAVVMDFDHITDNKTANVSKLVRLGSWSKVQSEIDKCELVCANCHRIRTRDRLR